MGEQLWVRRLGRQRLKASGYTDESPVNGADSGMSGAVCRKRRHRLRLIGVGMGLAVLLGGCTFGPEAARVRGEPGGDIGNHGHPVELLAPPDRFERIYSNIPYDGPAVASPDTSQS